MRCPNFSAGCSRPSSATSDDAYRRLIAKALEFYAQALFNPHWGEQIRIGRGFVAISMVFQGLDQQQAEATWKPFFDWVAASPQDFAFVSAPRIGALPARHFWDPSVLKRSRSRHRRRSAGRAGGQHLLGRQPRRGGRGLVRLPIRLAAGFAARSRTGAKASPTRCLRRRSIRACRCIATRGLRARRRRRSPRRRIRR